MKRMLALVLALMMALSLAATASAEGVKDALAAASGMTNEQLKAFVEAHPMLEQLDLRWNTQLTDLSCLLELRGLRQVFVSEDMQRAIRSLGEGYGFRLEID